MPQSVNWGKRPTKQREGREKLLDRTGWLCRLEPQGQQDQASQCGHSR